MVHHFLRNLGKARAVGHVELAEQRLLVSLLREPAFGRGAVVLVAIAQGEPHSCIGEGLRHAQPDARDRSGYEGDAAFPIFARLSHGSFFLSPNR